MSFRRNGKKAHNERELWNAFLDANSALAAAAGLTEPVLRSEDTFLDFLGHGFVDHHDDPTNLHVNQLSDGRYRKLVQFTGEYMRSFGSNISLIALRFEDQQRLRPATPEGAANTNVDRSPEAD